MATKPTTTARKISLNFPSSLDIKDLIMIVSVAVSLTVAWGVFSTRLTVLEREVAVLQDVVVAQNVTIDRLQQQVTRLSAHQQDDELLIDQIFSLIRRPPPTRRATN